MAVVTDDDDAGIYHVPRTLFGFTFCAQKGLLAVFFRMESGPGVLEANPWSVCPETVTLPSPPQRGSALRTQRKTPAARKTPSHTSPLRKNRPPGSFFGGRYDCQMKKLCTAASATLNPTSYGIYAHDCSRSVSKYGIKPYSD